MNETNKAGETQYIVNTFVERNNENHCFSLSQTNDKSNFGKSYLFCFILRPAKEIVNRKVIQEQALINCTIRQRITIGLYQN